MDNVNCVASGSVPGWVDAITGVGGGNDCIGGLLVDKVYMVPIFMCVSDTNTYTPLSAADCNPSSGTNTYYYITRFVAFQITGFKLTSTGGWDGHASTTTRTQCNHDSQDGKCIAGFFVENYQGGEGEADPNSPPGYNGPVVFEALG